jgi:hypothetical protein
MARKYVVWIDEVWTEFNKLWPAVKSVRVYLKADPTHEPRNVTIAEIDLGKGYATKMVPQATILRGVLWNDDEVPVEWTGALTANILATPKGTGLVNQPISFASSSVVILHTVVKYEWSFDGGATYTEGDRMVSHTFETPGTYRVFLRITNDADEVDRSKVLNYVVAAAPAGG